MIEKDPTNWSIATWALSIGMALAGGIVNWYGRVRQGHTNAFNLLELVGELFTSGFVGVGVFMTMQAIGQPPGICAAAAGVGGHMATRVLFFIGRLLEQRANKFLEK